MQKFEKITWGRKDKDKKEKKLPFEHKNGTSRLFIQRQHLLAVVFKIIREKSDISPVYVFGKQFSPTLILLIQLARRISIPRKYKNYIEREEE